MAAGYTPSDRSIVCRWKVPAIESTETESDMRKARRPSKFSEFRKFNLTRSRFGNIELAVPPWTKGAFRDRHGRWRRDAVDASGALTNALCADGQVVWS
jgi:hypothetical protein